jgi:FkbM family methyltransferase
MLFFDIGANIGKWALANSSPSTTIISVEASPGTYAQLKQNVQNNTNIVPLHYAVTSSSDPSVTFYHCKAANTISTLNKDWLSSPESRFGNYSPHIEEICVPAISLDKLIKIYGIPNLLKIDVEGAENIVLASLSQKVPEICFEWAAEMKSVNLECLDKLIMLGFTDFFVQMEDNYTFRPTYTQTASDVRTLLKNARPKVDWGMIWAR